MTKRILALCFILALLCAASACKSAEEPAGQTPSAPLAAGRYIESEIALPLPEGISEQMIVGVVPESGSLTVFTSAYVGENADFCCRYFRHTIGADGTVATASEGWLDALAPFGGNELHVIGGDDGTLYMLYSDYDENNKPRGHLLVSRDNGKTGEELTGDGIKALGTITGLGVFDDGSFVACSFYDGVALLLNEAGGRVLELESGNRGRIVSCAAKGALTALAVPESKTVRLYDKAAQSYTDAEFQFSERDTPVMAVTTDGALLLADSTGVYRRAAGGTLWEKLVDGETCTLGLPNFYAGWLEVAEDGGTYPTLYVADTAKLLVYRYDGDAPAAADKDLTVFSLRENDTVRQAIVAFSRLRPDVRVTYTVAMDGAAGGTEQDYIKALNTELLAGTGPDILLLDGLPVDSYIEKDVLADLTETASGAEPVLANICAAFAKDGTLYAVPTGFTAPFAIAAPGTEKAFADLTALAEAAENAGQPPLLSPCAFSYKTLALYLLKYYGGALRSGDASAAEAFLTDALRICAATGCTEKVGEGWQALADVPQDEMYEMFRDYIGSPQVFAVASGEAQALLMQPVGSVMGCMEPLAIAEQQHKAIGDIGGQFVPVGIVGVNKASAQPEAAAAFVQTLLSYAAQGGNPYAEQFPVNEQALSEMLAYQNDGVSSGMMLNDGGDFTAMWPGKAWRDALGTLIAGLDTPIIEDAALTEMLLPEIEDCLSGASSVQEAAGRIQSLLATYLSE